MKKSFLVWLALVLAMTLIFMLTACGEVENSENSQSSTKKEEGKNDEKAEEKYVSVTKDEWIKAFEFDGVNSFTFTYDETYHDSDDSSDEIFKGTFKYNNGAMLDILEQRYYNYDKIDAEDLCLYYFGASVQVFEETFEALDSDFVNYGYEAFTFDKKSGVYSGSFTHKDESYEIDICFGQNKYVAKMSIQYDGTDYGSGEYAFTDYNSTKNFSVPDDVLSEAKNEIVNYISSCNSYELSSEMEIDLGTNWVSTLQSFVLSLTPDDIAKFSYSVNEGSKVFHVIGLDNPSVIFDGTEYEFIDGFIYCQYDKKYTFEFWSFDYKPVCIKFD